MTPPGGSRFRVVLLAVLLVVALASAGTLVALLVRGGGTDSQPERDTTMKVAREFMVRLNTYGPDDLDAQSKQMPGYRKAVTALITPKFKASFEKSVSLAEQTVAQVQLQRKADLFGAGVSSLDSDSATVLVAGSFTNSYEQSDGKRFTDEPAPFRVAVQLVRIDGAWLVDDFAPVSEAGASDGTGDGSTGGATDAPADPTSPSGSASPSPSEGSTP